MRLLKRIAHIIISYPSFTLDLAAILLFLVCFVIGMNYHNHHPAWAILLSAHWPFFTWLHG